MSQDAAIARPAPSAGPFSAAITGTWHSTIEWNVSRERRLFCQRSPGCGSPAVARSLMSAPALNTLPAPVNTAARTSSRSVNESNVAVSASSSSRFVAFTGGRFIVTVATKSDTSRITGSLSLLIARPSPSASSAAPPP